jgi:SsrA-binding protein
VAADKEKRIKPLVNNRKVFADFEVLEKYEAGLSLLGTEVKSIRAGRISIKEAYCRVDGGEIWLVGANITEFDHGTVGNHAPLRKRKLLLHRREIDRIAQKMAEKGLTCVPIAIYLSGARVS